MAQPRFVGSNLYRLERSTRVRLPPAFVQTSAGGSTVSSHRYFFPMPSGRGLLLFPGDPVAASEPPEVIGELQLAHEATFALADSRFDDRRSLFPGRSPVDKLAKTVKRLDPTLARSAGDVGRTPPNEILSLLEDVLRSDDVIVLQTLTVAAGKLHLALVDLGYPGRTALIAVTTTLTRSADRRIGVGELRVIYKFGEAPMPEMAEKRRVILTMTSLTPGASPSARVFDLEPREVSAIQYLTEHREVSRFVSFLPVVRADRRGRIMIPRRLVEQARLIDDVLVVGAITHIELWNPEIFEDAVREAGERLRELSQISDSR